MSRLRSACALFPALCCAAVAGFLAGCGGAPEALLTPVEWEVAATLSRLPDPPPDPTNRWADDPRAARFGQQLFYDRLFSEPIRIEAPEGMATGERETTRRVSCADCHDPERWFSDPRDGFNARSLGVEWTSHNAPSLVNVAYYDWFGWAGGSDSLWMQSLVAFESPKTLDGSRLQVAHRLVERYAALYEEVFAEALPAARVATFPVRGRPGMAEWDGMALDDQDVVNRIFSNLGKAYAAYLRTLISRDSPFDRFVQTEGREAIPLSAQRGLKLFIGKAGCIQCHAGPSFSDQAFYNTGIPDQGPGGGPPDDGRAAALNKLLESAFNSSGAFSDDRDTGKLDGLSAGAQQLGQFRSKSLRQIAATGPWFHRGTATSLEDVVRFYNDGGAASGFAGDKDALMLPLYLTDAEVADLVAFLHTLTGEPPPAEWLRPPAP